MNYNKLESEILFEKYLKIACCIIYLAKVGDITNQNVLIKNNKDADTSLNNGRTSYEYQSISERLEYESSEKRKMRILVIIT